MTEEKIVRAIADAARRIHVALGGIEKEMRKTREVLEERLPMTVQPRAEDLTPLQADTVAALECCVEHPDCKGCPLVDDDLCSESLPKLALTTIKQLQEQLRAQPKPRAEERFELTERERDLIRIIKCCCIDDCESCELEDVGPCFKHLANRMLDMIERQLGEKGVDIDDL